MHLVLQALHLLLLAGVAHHPQVDHLLLLGRGREGRLLLLAGGLGQQGLLLDDQLEVVYLLVQVLQDGLEFCLLRGVLLLRLHLHPALNGLLRLLSLQVVVQNGLGLEQVLQSHLFCVLLSLVLGQVAQGEVDLSYVSRKGRVLVPFPYGQALKVLFTRLRVGFPPHFQVA